MTDRSNIRILPGFGERDVLAILEACRNADLDSVLVIGALGDGELFVASSSASAPYMNWLLDLTKEFIIENAARQPELD